MTLSEEADVWCADELRVYIFLHIQIFSFGLYCILAAKRFLILWSTKLNKPPWMDEYDGPRITLTINALFCWVQNAIWRLIS